MKKIGLFLILTAFCSAACRGQSEQMVWDPWTNSIYSSTYLGVDAYAKANIPKNQKKIAALQDSINYWLVDLKKVEQKNVDYLVEKQDSAVDIEDIAYIFNLLKDIKDYQQNTAKIVKNDPVLIPTVNEIEKQIIIRGSRVIEKIASFAKTGGKSNQLDNKERNDLIIAVIYELRSMRNCCSEMYDILLTAKRQRDVKNKTIEDYKDLMMINVATNE